MRIYQLFTKMIAKIKIMLDYQSILYPRFVYKFSPTKTVTFASGFSHNTSYTDYVNIMGGYLYVAVTTTKSSAWTTGNINNTTMATVQITSTGETNLAKTFLPIKQIGYQGAPNAYVSGLASVYKGTTTGDPYTFPIGVAAIDASTNSSVTGIRYAYPTWVTFESIISQ